MKENGILFDLEENQINNKGSFGTGSSNQLSKKGSYLYNTLEVLAQKHQGHPRLNSIWRISN